MLFLRLKKRQSSISAPSPSLLTAHTYSCPWYLLPLEAMGKTISGFDQIYLLGTVFLSLMGQSVTFYWKLKGEEKGEVCWFTVLWDFWLETEQSCGFTCKITNLSLKVSDLSWWVIFPNPLSVSIIAHTEPPGGDGRQLWIDETRILFLPNF